MANRLAGEKSPYLLQHAENPVDWYPWGGDALNRARAEDRPILVSIGYSACHWCHVMAHESFEDEETARLMNERFVNIKVDREERPDVDAIYMEAVQAMTGQGGWPLNVFLTPDGQPFFGGTYFPPDARHGIPSWRQVLAGVDEAFRERREDVMHNAETLTRYLREAQSRGATDERLSDDIFPVVSRHMAAEFDWVNGGFGAAPKFPQPLGLELLLRLYRRLGQDEALDFVRLTLRHMADGGIYDQLGGGFHRYATDAAWVVPHFEKMLYDNALLARLYLQAFQVTGEESLAHIVAETLDYLLRDLRSPEGGFYSAEDADSEGVEGRFYVWTPSEFDAVLGPDAGRMAAERYGVTPGGNFEGKTILTVAASVETVASRAGRTEEETARVLAQARADLLAARGARVRPGTDTKILAGWNGLAIRALAEAGKTLGRQEYLDAAERCARFMLSALRPKGSLVRSYREGAGAIPAFLEDYAFLVEALITLYETTFNVWYLERAVELAGEMVGRFGDEGGDGFFDAEAGDDLVVRPRSFFDNPIPSGNSAAASGLLRLWGLTGDEGFVESAVSVFRAAIGLMSRAPLAFSYALGALDLYLSTPTQIAIVGREDDESLRTLVRCVFDRYLPNRVLAVGEGDTPALLAGRQARDGRATAYVCERFSCRFPVTSADLLAEQLVSAGATVRELPRS